MRCVSTAIAETEELGFRRAASPARLRRRRSSDSAALRLRKRASASPPERFDVDSLFAQLAPSSDWVVYEPQDFAHGMREFAVRDPNGYTLMFGQPLD